MHTTEQLWRISQIIPLAVIVFQARRLSVWLPSAMWKLIALAAILLAVGALIGLHDDGAVYRLAVNFIAYTLLAVALHIMKDALHGAWKALDLKDHKEVQ